MIDLIGFMRIPGYNQKSGEHVSQALALLTNGCKISPPPQVKKNIFGLHNDLLAGCTMTDQVREYARSRGLTDKTMMQFNLCYYKFSEIDWMAIPTYDESRLVGVKLRNLAPNPPHKMRYRTVPGTTSGLFNINEVRGTTEPVFIVKGEIPAMLLCQNGFKACAPTGGETSTEGLTYWRSVLSFSAKRIVVGDNDPNSSTREKIVKATQARAKNLQAVCRYPPEEYKDIDEWILADKNALSVIDTWRKDDRDNHV